MVSNALGMSIRDISKTYNVTFRTLRFYESRGLLSPIRIGLTRIYTTKDEIRLQLIMKGKKLGFTLEEIRTLIASAPDKSSTIIESLPIEKIEAQITQLQARRKTIESSINDLQDALTRQAG